jgi:hypothetical protein
MDHLHRVIRSIKGEARPRRDHLSVFREFIGQLDRIGRRQARRGKGRGQQGTKRTG